jgi:hypothetical protein
MRPAGARRRALPLERPRPAKSAPSTLSGSCQVHKPAPARNKLGTARFVADGTMSRVEGAARGLDHESQVPCCGRTTVFYSYSEQAKFIPSYSGI